MYIGIVSGDYTHSNTRKVWVSIANALIGENITYFRTALDQIFYVDFFGVRKEVEDTIH